MAIDKYTLKDGSTRYRVSVYMNGERIAQKRGFKTKKEAKNYEAHVLLTAKRPKLATYESVEKLYIESLESIYKESTVYQIENQLKNHVPKEWRKRRIDAIKPGECQQLSNELSARYKSAAAFIGHISSVFEYAERMEIISKNPFSKIIKPAPRQKALSDEWSLWTEDELTRFLQEAKENPNPLAYPLFRLVLLTGMRRGEAIGLRWQDFDHDNMTVTIQSAVSLGRHGEPVQSTPKYNSSRTIAIDDETAEALEGLRPFSTDERIFPIGSTTVRRWFLKAEAAAGLPHSRLHNFRHEHTTMLLENGAYIKDVQERLGHRSAQTTLNIYAHASKDKRKVLDHLPKNHYTPHSDDA